MNRIVGNLAFLSLAMFSLLTSMLIIPAGASLSVEMPVSSSSLSPALMADPQVDTAVDFAIVGLWYDRGTGYVMAQVQNTRNTNFSGTLQFAVRYNNIQLPTRNLNANFSGQMALKFLLVKVTDYGVQGNVPVSVQVDPSNRVNETNENNNSVQQTLTISAPSSSPDLTITDIYQDNNDNVLFRVSNSGSAPFSGRLKWSWRLNEKQMSSNYKDISVLARGQTDISLGFRLTPCANNIEITLDPQQEVLELNERNNYRNAKLLPNKPILKILSRLEIGKPGASRIYNGRGTVIITPEMFDSPPKHNAATLIRFKFYVRNCGQKVIPYEIKVDQPEYRQFNSRGESKTFSSSSQIPQPDQIATPVVSYHIIPKNNLKTRLSIIFSYQGTSGKATDVFDVNVEFRGSY